MLLFLLPLYLLLIACRKSSKKLPPGSLGFPIIGQTFSFLSAMRKNRAEEWLQDKKRKYGPISKMSLLGAPTVFVCGQAANKFIYTCDDSILANQQLSSIRRLCGERNILELSGHEHKRVRGALVSILKPEVLKQYVGKMDEEVRKHFKIHWHGKKKVLVGQFYQTTKYLHYIKMISAYYGKCPNFHC
jgi:cytochrome P450 family 26 subfamily A